MKSNDKKICPPFEEEGNEAGIDYKSAFLKMANGFALHKIVLDDKCRPIDYEYVDVNSAFEKTLGLSRDKIIGQRITKLLPDIGREQTHWIERYGVVALKGEPVDFEDYSEALKRWFHIVAYSPKPGYFVTISEDITERKKVETELKDKNEELEKIFNGIVGREGKMIEMKAEIKALKDENKALKANKK